jgi:hypothetical protein
VNIMDEAISDLKKAIKPWEIDSFVKNNNAYEIHCFKPGHSLTFKIDDRYYTKIGPKSAVLKALGYFKTEIETAQQAGAQNEK